MAQTAGKRIFRRKRGSLNKTVDNFNHQEAAKTAAGFIGRPDTAGNDASDGFTSERLGFPDQTSGIWALEV